MATGRRWQETPSPASCRSISARASRAPLSTTCRGALWLATVTAPAQRASSAPRRSSSSSRATAVMAPPPRRLASAINSPRKRATPTAAIASKAPAAASAVTSPRLCPPKAIGARPSRAASRQADKDAQASAGCAHSVAVSRCDWRSASSSPNPGGGNTRSCSPSPANGSSRAASSHTRRTSSKCTARSPVIPTDWLPCPGKRIATGPGGAPSPK